MKKIMFYCQNLLGMGHLVRSTEIVRSLIKDFKVCLINGGEIVPGFGLQGAKNNATLLKKKLLQTQIFSALA